MIAGFSPNKLFLGGYVKTKDFSRSKGESHPSSAAFLRDCIVNIINLKTLHCEIKKN